VAMCGHARFLLARGNAQREESAMQTEAVAVLHRLVSRIEIKSPSCTSFFLYGSDLSSDGSVTGRLRVGYGSVTGRVRVGYGFGYGFGYGSVTVLGTVLGTGSYGSVTVRVPYPKYGSRPSG
jgi:hypothetical protein